MSGAFSPSLPRYCTCPLANKKEKRIYLVEIMPMCPFEYQLIRQQNPSNNSWRKISKNDKVRKMLQSHTHATVSVWEGKMPGNCLTIKSINSEDSNWSEVRDIQRYSSLSVKKRDPCWSNGPCTFIKTSTLALTQSMTDKIWEFSLTFRVTAKTSFDIRHQSVGAETTELLNEETLTTQDMPWGGLSTRHLPVTQAWLCTRGWLWWLLCLPQEISKHTLSGTSEKCAGQLRRTLTCLSCLHLAPPF